jgi:hypothetical protein
MAVPFGEILKTDHPSNRDEAYTLPWPSAAIEPKLLTVPDISIDLGGSTARTVSRRPAAESRKSWVWVATYSCPLG